MKDGTSILYDPGFVFLCILVFLILVSVNRKKRT